MKEMVPCYRCGGQREHDLRTGEVLPCDVCGERLCEACEAGNHWECIGHFCECRAPECRKMRGIHVVCPGCKEGRHSQYFGVPQHRERVYIVGGLGHEGPVLVLFEGLPKAEPGNAGKAPPQAVVPVAINPYQHGSNGVGISYVVHTLDSRPDRVVLAPLDGGGVGGPPGVPRRMDVARTRLVGNAVTANVAEWLGRRIVALDGCILRGEEIHVGIL